MSEWTGPDDGELLVLDRTARLDDWKPVARRPAALWVVIGAACLVVSLIAAVGVVAMRANGGPDKQPVMTRAGNTIEQGLWNVAARAATQAGTTLKAAQAVQTTGSAALWAVMHATSSRTGNEKVWVVQALGQGKFKPDPGVPGVPGKYMVLMVHRATMDGYGGGISPTPLDLSALGTVVDLSGD